MQLVDVAHKASNKKLTTNQLVSWLVKDLNISRKHAKDVASKMSTLGLVRFQGRNPSANATVFYRYLPISETYNRIGY